jgi:hypothetical protein
MREDLDIPLVGPGSVPADMPMDRGVNGLLCNNYKGFSWVYACA